MKQQTEIYGLVNGHQVDDKLFRAGELTTNGVQQLFARGVTRIICLKDRDKKREILVEELIIKDVIKKLGSIEFFWKPLDNNGWFSYSDGSEVPEILALIENAPAKVLVHCHKGADRTGTVVACWRILHGWTVDEVTKEMREYGNAWYNFGMRRFVREFGEIKSHR